MNKGLLLGVMLSLACSVNAEIYKWVDSQGGVHFSDHPHEGSEPLKLPETQTYSQPEQQKNGNEGTSNQNSGLHVDKHEYTKLAITQPEDESTIRNTDGYVVVAIEIEPQLAPEDKLQLIFDGSPLGEPQSNTVFQLNGIYRGKHTIAVQALDATGEVLKTSNKITIFMQQPRVNMGKPKGS